MGRDSGKTRGQEAKEHLNPGQHTGYNNDRDNKQNTHLVEKGTVKSNAGMFIVKVIVLLLCYTTCNIQTCTIN